MSEKKDELILVSLALVICSVLIFYNTFSVPSKYIRSIPQTSVSERDISESSVLINVNTATAYELCSLPGIGEKTAESIVEYRNENGFFASKEELLNVRGIGENLLNKIYGSITY